MRYQAALRPDEPVFYLLLTGRFGHFPAYGYADAWATVPAMGQRQEPSIPWLDPGQAFPPIERALGPDSDAAGLLAAGGCLDVQTLRSAYRQCIFPWFSEGQPILWWSPDPRMVLQADHFRLRSSLRKTLHRFTQSQGCAIRFDSDFEQVVARCASSPRVGSGGGTWILAQMQAAYLKLHQAGHAHSVETWIDGQLVGGLYCVSIGKAVFGESMFSLRSDASKIALAALVAFCRANGIGMIDCQQNTRHLASLGAAEMGRTEFRRHCESVLDLPAPRWVFEPLYWRQLLPDRDAQK